MPSAGETGLDIPAGAIVAIDPGRSKCGLACLSPTGSVLYRSVLSVDELLPALQALGVDRRCDVIVGDGTGHRELLSSLIAAGLEPDLVDERGTSEEARRRCLLDRREGCLTRMIPIGLRCPSSAYDDYVACILAERRRAVREFEST